MSILALNALFLADSLPPGVAIYVPVLDAELAASTRILGQLTRGRTLQIEKIKHDWRASETEQEEAEESTMDPSER